ncbi:MULTISPECIES: TetR/AcrR family transcriptional regulator [Streptomyces]|uniref:TetR/AcrR family transcriptional regulator n=1 Tax=Streptomyces TaxID=1883 RepID=UPI0010400F70|nr:MULTISPECIES: TetR/AcrR family transcriptional regulator [Streptomyces]MBT3077914.1 TetR/AcrR family transcriptional regulator [Streptomyces sp. COG21]MBT3084758.1 TetR/AcrR family transcriptional regulator [Streptomyces sp. COG20]MBT3085518.1 TetR/AcrR family transcriptional regulator [Streptomyces sp. CYG21]MBT3100282.1 TetR/AcrR family transcriptional regulator [Streptomyces sp. CBG30]MBT3103293.1 TetR/AcrR family transcriptional regulator [Streptomyces sp. COG19]
MTGQRADARRNYSRILAVAEAEVARHGSAASLEQVARTAGVGSATVRRHFPTRQALLEAVFQERVQTLCRRAAELHRTEDSRAALLEWLHDLLVYAVSARGLADALTYEPPTDRPADASAPDSCGAQLADAAAPLLARALDDGAVRAGTTFHDLLTLAVGIALATEHYTEPSVRADRLFTLAVEGLSPSPSP